jgi:glycosyltransferase 2 family protein
VSALRSGARTLLRVSVSAGLLAFLLSRFGVRDVLEVCLRAQPVDFAVALAIYLASQLLSALRWQRLAHGVGFVVSLPRYVQLYAIGMFFGLVVPSTLGSDAARALTLGRREPGRALALSSVAFDRLVGLVSLVAIAVTALLVGPSAGLPPSINGMIVVGGLALVALWLAAPAVARLLPEDARLRRLIDLDLAPYFRDPRLLTVALSLSVLVHLLQIAAQYALAKALGLRLSPGFVAVYHPLVALAAAVPLTIGGFGIREAAYAYLLPHAGVPPDDAVALGLLWWAVGAMGAVLGGIVYALSPGEKVRLSRMPRRS